MSTDELLALYWQLALGKTSVEIYRGVVLHSSRPLATFSCENLQTSVQVDEPFLED